LLGTSTGTTQPNTFLCYTHHDTVPAWRSSN
jgi:hypothetical protein